MEHEIELTEKRVWVILSGGNVNLEQLPLQT
jgi:threonine dehydratase